MSALVVEVVDVGAQSLGDAQAVEGQQQGQGVDPGRAQTGLDQQGVDLVAVEARCAGLVVDRGPAQVGGRVR